MLKICTEVTAFYKMYVFTVEISEYKGGKHVTCDVIFATVRTQPYWKLYPYVVRIFAFFSITQKVYKQATIF